jgi:hypothetical protein
MNLFRILIYVLIVNLFGISGYSDPITAERLEQAVKLGATFTKDYLYKQYSDLDLEYNPKTLRFYPSAQLKAKLASFGSNETAKEEFLDEYANKHRKYFEIVRKEPGYTDFYQIHRVPHYRGMVQFVGTFTRFQGENEKVLIGKESDLVLGAMFKASFEWKTAAPNWPDDDLRQFYIKWIGVESGYETGRGIGTPAVKTLIGFVEKNELADLITVDARSDGSRKIFFEKLKGEQVISRVLSQKKD